MSSLINDVVADQVPTIKPLFQTMPKSLAVQFPLGCKSGPGIAPRILGHTVKYPLQRDFLRDTIFGIRSPTADSHRQLSVVFIL